MCAANFMLRGYILDPKVDLQSRSTFVKQNPLEKVTDTFDRFNDTFGLNWNEEYTLGGC